MTIDTCEQQMVQSFNLLCTKCTLIRIPKSMVTQSVGGLTMTMQHKPAKEAAPPKCPNLPNAGFTRNRSSPHKQLMIR